MDFPGVKMAIGRPAQLLAVAKEAFEANELAQETSIVPAQGFRQERRARADQCCGLAGCVLFVRRQACTS
jgi:hypothetical protein